MINYTIYCTEEQTQKALGLGAPIKKRYRGTDGLKNFYDQVIPTAEQMIGWLEDGKIKKIRIDSLSYEDHEEWFYSIFNIENNNISFKRNYTSRPEATIASIDAALEYLSNNKK